MKYDNRNNPIIQEKIQRIKEHLVDDESRVYFEARHGYAKHGKISLFYDSIRRLNVHYTFRDSDLINQCNQDVYWLVWDVEDVGPYHIKVLQDAGCIVAGLVSNKTMQNIDIPIISLEECVALIKTGQYAMLTPLNCKSELPEDIRESSRVIFVNNHLVGRCGWQYFDFFASADNEIFIDGGALDGRTSIEFIKWCNGSYDHIYAFEANPISFVDCKSTLSRLSNDRIILYERALWDCCKTLRFENETKTKWDACVSECGNIVVQSASIDEVIDSRDNVSFIKLDVEGSEKQALIGAKTTIKRCKPRMAISIYHNPLDYIEIPYLILKLDDSYRFSIRHYHSDAIETILYAF